MTYPPPGATQQLGREAEARAARFLEQRGHRVLARNVRYRCGELDLVTRSGDCLCIVEVRMKSSNRWGHPFETVGPIKRARVLAAARRYLAENGHLACPVRFDVVSVEGRWPAQRFEHFPNAFDAEGRS